MHTKNLPKQHKNPYIQKYHQTTTLTYLSPEAALITLFCTKKDCYLREMAQERAETILNS
jgi:hypothetical protein